MARWATIDNPHELRTKTGDGRDLVFLTGTAVTEFVGTSSAWMNDDLYVLVGPTWTSINQVAPAAALASIFKGGQATNAGWAADNCRWDNYSNQVRLIVRMAVSGTGDAVYRYAYNAAVVGTLA